jgi:hypothetical protein
VQPAPARILLGLLLISESGAVGASARLQRGGIKARTVTEATEAVAAAQVRCLEAMVFSLLGTCCSSLCTWFALLAAGCTALQEWGLPPESVLVSGHTVPGMLTWAEVSQQVSFAPAARKHHSAAQRDQQQALFCIPGALWSMSII